MALMSEVSNRDFSVTFDVPLDISKELFEGTKSARDRRSDFVTAVMNICSDAILEAHGEGKKTVFDSYADLFYPSYANGRGFWKEVDGKPSLVKRTVQFIKAQGLDLSEKYVSRIATAYDNELKEKDMLVVMTVSELKPRESAREHFNEGSCLWGMYREYREKLMTNFKGLSVRFWAKDSGSLLARCFLAQTADYDLMLDPYGFKGSNGRANANMRQTIKIASLISAAYPDKYHVITTTDTQTANIGGHLYSDQHIIPVLWKDKRAFYTVPDVADDKRLE